MTKSPAPVEYAVAVDQYLAQAPLGAASRRVYQISLAGWAWPLVGKPVPARRERRGATPPAVPLSVLDAPDTVGRLATAIAERAVATDARTVNRELSALRSAAGWWREQGWIEADPVAGLRHARAGALVAPLTDEQVSRLFRLPASLREHAFWRLLHDSGAPAAEILALDADRLDLSRHRTRPYPRPGTGPGIDLGIEWRETTGQVLRWLLAGRTWGPVFLTGRRAPAGSDPKDTCRLTGHARMSYRRAAEIFTIATRPLDPTGRGWTLHQLSHQLSRERDSPWRAGSQGSRRGLRCRWPLPGGCWPPTRSPRPSAGPAGHRPGSRLEAARPTPLPGGPRTRR